MASITFDRTLRIGRQDKGEPRPFSRVGDKVVVAINSESHIARKQASIELVGQQVRITNTSSTVPIEVEGFGPLKPGSEAQEFELGVLFSLPKGLAFRVETDAAGLSSVGSGDSNMRTLAWATIAPGQEEKPLPLLHLEDGSGRMETSQVVDWLKTAIELLQFAATADDFYMQAAMAVNATVHLDSCKVLVINDLGAMESTAEFPDQFQHSDTVVNAVCAKKRTVVTVPNNSGSSLDRIEAVAAAPILNREGDVVGVVYGQRNRTFQGRAGISNTEAAMVEVIAKSVAAGVARQDREKVAARKQVMFEQFFTPKLARRLEEQPKLLDGKEQDISCLFVDIRNFSAVSREIGAQRTMRWINDVMDVLSECVLEHGGVLVDYIGDELMAMWGAPDDRQDHSKQACLAAIDMMRRLPEIDQTWSDTIPSKTKVGIGINSGPAFVGNSGSKHKFKYGPLGNTVNLGSRVQGTTKLLGTTPIVTAPVRDGLLQVDSKLETRRLCSVRVVGIPDFIDLYELQTDGSKDWLVMRDRYESALAAFDEKDFKQAIRELADLHADFPDDRPTIRLLSRAVDALATSPAEEHPIWILDTK